MSATQAIDWSKYATQPAPQIDFSKYETPAPAPQASTYQQLTAGYNPKVEEWAEKHPVVGPIVRFLDATGGAFMASPEAAARLIHDIGERASGSPLPTETELQLADSLHEWATNPNVRKAAISLLPEALGQGTGSYTGGEAVTAGAGAAATGAAKAAGAGRTALAAAKPTILQLAEKGVTKTALEKVANALPDTPQPPEFPGAQLPSVDEFYAQRGGEIEKARRLQDVQARREATAARIAAKQLPAPDPFAGMTSTANPGGANLQLPPPPETGIVKTQPQFVQKFAPPETPQPSKIITPEEAEKPLRVEGSYWSFKEAALRRAVMSGDREAAVVYKQRFGELPPGASYLTDVGSGSTKGLYRSLKDLR